MGAPFDPPPPLQEWPPRPKRVRETVAELILAALEHQGYFSSELAEAINTLSASVTPLDYAGAKTAVSDMIGHISCWDACLTCRHEYLTFKANLIGYHGAGHPQPAEQVSEQPKG